MKLFCFLLPPSFVYKHFIKKRYQYDYEVAFLEGVPTKLVAKSNNPNKYAWVHTDMWIYYEQEKVFRTIEKAISCYKSYKKIVCVSNGVKEGFKKRFGFVDNIEVKYNPINESLVREKAKAPITEFSVTDNTKLVSVGRLVPQKGYDRLLAVHKALIEEGLAHELWIVGEGAERDKFEEYILQNKLQSTVKLIGFSDNPYKYIDKADIFVSSSIVEGFSLVCLEALLCDKPIICTDCGGAKELLGASEYGLLVENSEDGIYNGLKRILTDKKLCGYYKEKAIERGSMFLFQESIERIEDLF